MKRITRHMLRFVVVCLCFIITGTLLLAALIHYQCTSLGGFTLLFQTYECAVLEGLGEPL